MSVFTRLRKALKMMFHRHRPKPGSRRWDPIIKDTVADCEVCGKQISQIY